MAVYRNIQTTFWTDARIADDFTPEDRYFYLYLFTNPHTNLCGCYEISKKQVALETGYSIESIDSLLKRFELVHKVIRFCPETKEVLIVNWHKYNWTLSKDFRKALFKEITSIKSTQYREYLTSIYEGGETVLPPSYDGGGTTVTVSVTDTVTDTDSVKKTKRFIAPSVDDVRAYCRERGNSVNADSFVNFYESKGWKVGKEPMKDWKAAVRTWEQREEPKKGKALDYSQRQYTDDQISAIERRKLGLV